MKRSPALQGMKLKGRSGEVARRPHSKFLMVIVVQEFIPHLLSTEFGGFRKGTLPNMNGIEFPKH